MAPQFKKLTDCPENLREAIDWLIQVRHGSGGKGEGLNKLAGALKKLIEEAIEKAYTTNFDALLNILNSVKSYTCCKEKVAEIDKIKEPKISTDYLNTLLQRVKDVNECSKNHIESSQQKSYEEIVSKLDQLKNLKESLKGLTENNNCEKLLENLCSGLETFLGFDHNSKGYNGTGIVYSDLDRLYDGVLGFLLKCMEHSQELLSHYYKDINVNIEVLRNAVGKGLGISGFVSTIENVQSGLKGYESSMMERTEAVKTNLKSLSNELEDNILYISMVDTDPKKFDVAVANWVNTVMGYLKKHLKMTKDTINDLDPCLQNNIENEFCKISHEIHSLRSSADRDVDQLSKLGKKVDSRLEYLRSKMDRAVEMQVRKLQRILEKHLKDIQIQVEQINATLSEYVGELTEWIGKSEKILTNALEKVEEILDGVKDGRVGNKGKSKTTLINEKTTEMQTKAEALHDAYLQAKEGVKEQAAEAVLAIRGLEGLYIKKLNDMKKKIDDKVESAMGALKGLSKQVNQGLEGMRTQHIDGAIQSVIRFLEKGVKKASGDAAFSTAVVIQAFNTGLEDRESVPNLHKWSYSIQNSSSLRNVIDGLDQGGNHLTPFQNVLKELSNNQNGNGTFYENLTKDIQKKVEDTINKVTSDPSQFSTVFSALHTQIMGSGSTTVHGKIETIKTQFNNDFKGSSDNPEFIQNNVDSDGLNRSVLEAAIRSTHEEGFTTSDNTIENQHHILKGTTFKDLLEQMTNELLKIAGLVDQKAGPDPSGTGTGIKQFIEQLRTKISKANGNELTHIRDEVHTLRTDTIIKLCKTIDTLLSKTLPIQTELTISTINTYLQKQVTDVVDDIKKNALERYVASKTTEMQTLRDLVGQQISNILHVIEYDFNKRMKGVLKAMYGNNGKNLDPFRNNEYVNNITTLAAKMYVYFKEIVDCAGKDVKTIKHDFTALNDFNSYLQMPFVILSDVSHFNHDFANKLSALSEIVDGLQPLLLPDAGRPVLGAMKEGLGSLVNELQKAYVSTYSQQVWDDHEEDKYAKVCLSILEILNKNLNKLKRYCGSDWNAEKINSTTNLGELLDQLGYKVPTNKDMHDGELRNKSCMKGHQIIKLLTTTNGVFDQSSKAPIVHLHRFLKDYYKICHLAVPSTNKFPYSVHEMLLWICGLQHNESIKKLGLYVNGLFSQPKKENEINDPSKYILNAYPNNFNSVDVTGTLLDVCSYAEKTLIAILGYGHSEGRYACDFNTNLDCLTYPSDSGQCFDLLVEILQRVYHQLYFVFSQCHRASNDISWRECHYGKDVGGSSWKCNELQCSECDTANKCSTHPICGLKSPLQSFLEDGLQGFLPHPFDKPDCKITCSLPNHNCIPCKTPMGFTDISVTASHKQRGAHLMKVLTEFCGQTDKPLSRLCSYLICILQRPPHTLDEMFAFYYNLIVGWGTSGEQHKQIAFDNAATQAYFGVPYPELNVSSIWYSSDHSHRSHGTGDLFSVFICDNGESSSNTCGRYMQPFGLNTWTVYSKRNANRYLSWIVYLTGTFYDLLEKLWKECCENCDSAASRCYSKTCASNCPRLQKYPISVNHTDECKSIAQCPFTRPTLYKHGFVLNSLTNLNGKNGLTAKRTCRDFCKALEIVIDENHALFTLAYKTIPEFLFKIRAPFLWTTVALWLLSLLYLLHIMVIRLDLLHIKSHLHSPSSHRIAAQSLLAAARVGKLAKISYLQP